MAAGWSGLEVGVRPPPSLGGGAGQTLGVGEMPEIGLHLVLPEPFVDGSSKGGMSRERLLLLAAALANERGGVLGVTSPSRAVVAAAALAAMTSGRQVLLAHIPDDPARQAMAGAFPEMEMLPEESAAEIADRAAEWTGRDGAEIHQELPPLGRRAGAAVGLMTGGSTGVPKVVWKRSDSLLGEVSLWRERLALSAEERTLSSLRLLLFISTG